MTAAVNNQLQGGYLYDAAGNMTHDATSGWNYAFDQANRITGANDFTYTYDGDGNRVGKANGSSGTIYWYMTPGIVAESDLSGNLQSEYVFFDGERVARKDFPGGAVSYYFSDHLKTTDIVTDAQGNIKNESDFYPWGGELQFAASDSNHYKFTGKERDSETGLDYFGARYYSNGLGRFITPDWSATPVPVPYADLTDPQSLNQYSYVRNVPTSRVDLDGHWPSWRDVLNFTAGAANAYGSDNLLGAGRVEQTTTAGKLGAAIGDGAATIQGVFEAGEGVAVDLAAIPLDAVGVGELIQVVGTVQALHGGATALTGFTHLAKSASESKPYEPTPKNLENMKKGEAPVGNDGNKVELHHDGQKTNSPVKEMTRTDHRGKGNFKKNHQNTGQKKSQVDRTQADKDRAAHWKAEHEKHQDQK